MEHNHPKTTQIEATTSDSIMDSKAFPRFPYLPQELRELVWKAAAETTEAAETPKVHAFSLRCPGPCAFCTDERTKSRPITLGFSHKPLKLVSGLMPLDEDKHAHAVKPDKFRAPVCNAWSYSDGLNMPSHNDSALWNACPDSRDVVRRHSDHDKLVTGRYRTHDGDNQIITIRPQADLILLDFPHPDRGRMDFEPPSPHPVWSPDGPDPRPVFAQAVGHVAIRFEPGWLNKHELSYGRRTMRLDWVGYNELKYFACAIHDVLGRVDKIWFVDYGLRRTGYTPMIRADAHRQVFSANGGRFVEVRHYDMGWTGNSEDWNVRHRLDMDASGLTSLLFSPPPEDQLAVHIRKSLCHRSLDIGFMPFTLPELGVLAYEASN